MEVNGRSKLVSLVLTTKDKRGWQNIETRAFQPLQNTAVQSHTVHILECYL